MISDKNIKKASVLFIEDFYELLVPQKVKYPEICLNFLI